MEPAITIIAYLWDARTTWIKHHDECTCDFETLAIDALRSIDPALWVQTNEFNENRGSFIFRTREQWNELVGPKAQILGLNERAEQLTNAASELFNAALNLEHLA